MFPTRSVLLAAVAVSALLTAGGPSVARAEGQATGTITIDGKPLAEGKITFHRDNGQFVGSKVKDGNYTIDRLTAGRLKVTVEGKGVRAAYTSEATTPLQVEATEGATILDIKLEK